VALRSRWRPINVSGTISSIYQQSRVWKKMVRSHNCAENDNMSLSLNNLPVFKILTLFLGDIVRLCITIKVSVNRQKQPCRRLILVLYSELRVSTVYISHYHAGVSSQKRLKKLRDLSCTTLCYERPLPFSLFYEPMPT
jgi:hypothetical protein